MGDTNDKFAEFEQQVGPKLAAEIAGLSPEEREQFFKFREDAVPDPLATVTAYQYAARNWLRVELKVGWIGIEHREWVWPHHWRGWIAYQAERRAAYEAKADFDFASVPQADRDAASEHWFLSGHRGYFDWLPNTRAEFDKILRDHHARRAENDSRTARNAAAAAKRKSEQRRLAALVIELKSHVFPVIGLPPIDLAKLHAAQQNPVRSERRLLKRWTRDFEMLPAHVQEAWTAYYTDSHGYEVSTAGDNTDHDDDADADDDAVSASWSWREIHLTQDLEREAIYPGNADAVAAGLADPAFERFRKFSEGIRRLLDRLDGDMEGLINPDLDAPQPRGLRMLEEIEDVTTADIVPGIIPRDVTLIYGLPEAGKSAFAHKLAICVADPAEVASFIEGVSIEYGRVAYITLDSGASVAQVKKRMITVRDKLDIGKLAQRLMVTDDELNLRDTASVDHFIELNKGKEKFKLLMIDPLFRAVPGTVVGDGPIKEALAGAHRLLRVADGVVILAHPTRTDDHLYGSIFQDADASSVLHVVRAGDNVTVTVEKTKNDTRRKVPLEYRLDGAYLTPRHQGGPQRRGRPAEDAAEAIGDLYARIHRVLPPDKWMASGEAFKLIEHLLPGKDATTRRQQWQRARKGMAAKGSVEMKGSGRRLTITRRKA